MGVYTTINDGTVYYQGLSYAGNGGTAAQTYTGNSNMQPDLCVGRKTSASGDSWYWVDSTRGASRRLMSDNSLPEDGYGIGSFNADGFTVTSSGNQNSSGQTYINFGWKANGGTTATNNVGSIQSTVQVNSTSKFSVVRWTGNGNSSTNIGHGLGVAPKMVIVKNTSENRDWGVWAKPIWDTNNAGRMYLNLTDQVQTSSGSPWFQNLNTTASQFYVGDSINTNGNGDVMIAYCFAEVQGYSKIASYSGNGNVDGPFIYTGFKPAWFIIKRMDNAGNWTVFNNKSSSSNGSNEINYSNDANANNAQETGGGGSVNDVDFLSNGIKIRSTNGDINASGNSVLYMAFAQNPFVTSDGVPTTAR